MDTRKIHYNVRSVKTHSQEIDNLLRRLKKYHSESIPSRIPFQENQKIQTLFIRIDDVLHSFYNDHFRSKNVWEDRMDKKTVKT